MFYENTCNKIMFTVLLLNKPDRMKIFDNNKRKIDNLFFHTVPDGSNVMEVINRFRQTGMVYHQLQYFEYGGPNGKMLDLRLYGMLSSFIAKFEMFAKQVTDKIPWSVIIEDDIMIDKGFRGFICNLTERFELDPTLNMIRLGTWAEGYMTSFESSKNILRCLCRMGVYQNIDNQLRDICGPDLYIQPPHSSWHILVEANEGHSKKTKFVNETMLRGIIPDKNSICSKLRGNLIESFSYNKKKIVKCMLNKVKSEKTGDCVQKPWYDFKSCTDEIREDKEVCWMHEWMLSHCHLSCFNHSSNVVDRKGLVTVRDN